MGGRHDAWRKFTWTWIRWLHLGVIWWIELVLVPALLYSNVAVGFMWITGSSHISDDEQMTWRKDRWVLVRGWPATHDLFTENVFTLHIAHWILKFLPSFMQKLFRWVAEYLSRPICKNGVSCDYEFWICDIVHFHWVHNQSIFSNAEAFYPRRWLNCTFLFHAQWLQTLFYFHHP